MKTRREVLGPIRLLVLAVVCGSRWSSDLGDQTSWVSGVLGRATVVGACIARFRFAGPSATPPDVDHHF